MASAKAFLPRIVALGRGTAQSQLRSVLQQCNVSKPFVVTDKNLEALTRNVLDSNDINGEIYADEVDEPTSDRVNAMAAGTKTLGATASTHRLGVRAGGWDQGRDRSRAPLRTPWRKPSHVMGERVVDGWFGCP